MSNNEWELVDRAKNGDVHAFSLLYQKYYKDLYRCAFCYTKGSHNAEDAVSSAILKAFENLKKLKKNDSFKSWLFQITANECRTLLRRSTIYLEGSDYAEPAFSETGFETPEIYEILSQLNAQERLIITMSVFAGYNSREIAKLLHKKEGTIRSLKSRSLAKLRMYLGAENLEKEGASNE